MIDAQKAGTTPAEEAGAVVAREAAVVVFLEAAGMAEQRPLAGEHAKAGTSRARSSRRRRVQSLRQELLQNSSSTGMLEAAGLRQDTRHSGCGELQEAERMQAGQRQGRSRTTTER